MKTTEIFNGTDGMVWLSTDSEEVELGSFLSFTLKQKNNFEDVDLANDYGKGRKFVGFELSGTITKHKIDNLFNKIMEQYSKGIQPDISLIAKAENPTTGKLERIKVIDVTFDEKDLMSLEQKKNTAEEIPFEARKYVWIDSI